MGVGDSCIYPYDGPDHDKIYVRVRTSVLRWARLNNRKFITEQTETGVLIQRIE